MKKAKLSQSVESNSKDSEEDDDQQFPQSPKRKTQLKNCSTTSSLEEEDLSSTDETNETSSTSVENLDYFSHLPIELILKIFFYLDSKSIGRCALMNRKLNEATLHPQAFRSLYVALNDRKIGCKLFHCLMKRSQVVTKIDFRGAFSLEKECPQVFLQFLKQCCQDLKFLRLRYCKIISYEALMHIGSCKNLTVVDLCHAPCMTSGVPTMLGLTKLIRLDLAMTDITHEFLVLLLQANPNLQILEISHCPRLKLDEIAEIVADNNKFLRLWNSVGNKSMTIVGVDHLSKLADLLELSLDSCEVLNCTDWIERIILGCPSLYRMGFTNFKYLTDEELLPILKMKRGLARLSLRACGITENICEKVLQTYPKLKLFDLRNCKISHEKMFWVQEWTTKYPKVDLKCKPFEIADLFAENPFRQLGKPLSVVKS